MSTRLTSLPAAPLSPPTAAPNPAREVQQAVGEVMSVAMAPIDAANMAIARSTQAILQILPSFPAARLFADMVLGWPHAHGHPPNLIPPAPPVPLPSIGPVICAGAVSVLINGLPAARCGDVGFGVWCGGFFPLFEVQTGSSHVFIGGARPARMLIDFTRHCMPGIPGLGKLGAAMMAFSAGMSGLQVAASLTDMSAAEEAAAVAPSPGDAAAASASASAAGLGAAVAAAQAAADIAAAALQAGMGKDPAIPPGIPLGNFITGSSNVLIGGFPMPGWMAILRGLGRLLRGAARRLGRSRPRDGPDSNGCTRRGCPVDVVSGKLFNEEEDFCLDGPLLFQLRRFYSSVNDRAGALGPGWIHNLEVCLRVDEEKTAAYYTDEEGRLSRFDLPPAGGSAYNPLEQIELQRIGPESYKLLTPERLEYSFDTPADDGEGGSVFLLSRISDGNRNQIVLSYEGSRLQSASDPLGRTYLFNYTPSGRLAGVRLKPSGEEPEEELVRYQYDGEDRLSAVLDPLGQAQRYAYRDGLLIRETNRNGFSFYYEYEWIEGEAWVTHTWGDQGLYDVTFRYDLDAMRTYAADHQGVVVYCWNELGLVETEIDPYGRAWRTAYDGSGNVLEKIDPLGNTQQWDYDARGNLTSETDALGRVTTYSYNDLDLITRIEYPGGETENFSYDEQGNLLQKVDAAGGLWRHEYDGRGLLTATVDPDGSRLQQETSQDWRQSWIGDDLGRLSTYELDHRGDVTARHDARGVFVRYDRDRLGRVVRETYRDGSQVELFYDGEGNVTSVRTLSGTLLHYRYNGRRRITECTDALGHRLQFEFDPAEVLTRVLRPDGQEYWFDLAPAELLGSSTTFDGRTRSFDHDGAMRTTAAADGAGRVTHFFYDGVGNLVRIAFHDGSQCEIRYNQNDQILEARGPQGAFRREYDVRSNVLWEEVEGVSVESAYDILGRRIRRITARRSLEYQYDVRGRVTSIADGEGNILEFEYDDLNRPVARSCHGLRETRRYDQLNRLLQQTVTAQGKTVLERRYHYDPAGRLAAIDDSLRGRLSYRHDANGRVVLEDRPGQASATWTYDSIGGLTAGPQGSFQFDSQDHLIAADGRRYSYNDRGQVESIQEGARLTRLGYDAAGRLVRVDHPDGRRTEFGYDVLGRRLFKRHDGRETRYLWDVNNLIGEQEEGRSVEYLYVEDQFEPLAMWEEEECFFYVNDHLGTPRELFAADGTLVWQSAFHLWGDRRPTAALVRNPLRFAGQYYDGETGLHYNRHRYYDSRIGRYLSPDPFGLEGGINLYSYVENPLQSIDPYGLEVYNFTRDGQQDGRGAVRIETERVGSGDGSFERPVRASGRVAPTSTAGRGDAPRPLSGYNTRNTNYDKGHLFALQNGGPDVSHNIVPQGASFQEHGRWRKMERWVNRQARAGRNVQFDVRVNYRGNGRVPTSFDVTVRVDGKIYRNPPPFAGNRNRRPIANQCQ